MRPATIMTITSGDHDSDGGIHHLFPGEQGLHNEDHSVISDDRSGDSASLIRSLQCCPQSSMATDVMPLMPVEEGLSFIRRGSWSQRAAASSAAQLERGPYVAALVPQDTKGVGHGPGQEG